MHKTIDAIIVEIQYSNIKKFPPYDILSNEILQNHRNDVVVATHFLVTR